MPTTAGVNDYHVQGQFTLLGLHAGEGGVQAVAVHAANQHADARQWGDRERCNVGRRLSRHLKLQALRQTSPHLVQHPPDRLAQLVGLRVVPLTAYRVLMIATWPIGFVVLPLLIALIFYGVFTPMGLMFRWLGRDAMGRRIDRNAKSYWVDRGAPRSADSYLKLY